jgi:predicted membrane chloride channel (bestrophin family)
MLALLLAFRLNRTYDRWWQARCAFGGIGGGLINIVRQVATYSNDTVLIRNHQKWSMCMIYGERS